jgi:circadian clock protein KaiC
MNNANSPQSLAKSLTGIRGLDEITEGGLPKGRPSLICGNAGCGKTILGMEFLLHGALEYGEPGVFVSFEETGHDLTSNFAALGYDLKELDARRLLAIEYVYIERSEIEEAGDYNLDGLFVRLGLAIDAIGAKRIVLDTIEVLFGGLSNGAILRAELRRLFRWFKDRGVTAIITGERGELTLTRYGLEEYVADCVILLDLRVEEQIATRRLRIVKYRGSEHGANEYPFLIDKQGISILPITSLGLDHTVSNERISSGIPRLDTMLSGAGYYRGSSILVSGAAGSGKSSVSSKFIETACSRGEKCLFFAFEESPQQIMRNMRSIGIDLAHWVEQGLLRFHASRPSVHGLEMHLVTIHKLILDWDPAIVVVDPISALAGVGSDREAKSMLTRLIDFLKTRKVTTLLTGLTNVSDKLETGTEEMPSMIDTWLSLRDIEYKGERNRGMYILKSRGMAHSNQIREFILSDKGIDLVDVYLGPEGVLTGAARVGQEAQDKSGIVLRQQELQRKKREYEHKRQALEANISALREEFDTATEIINSLSEEEQQRDAVMVHDRADMAKVRRADLAVIYKEDKEKDQHA